ncbi:hypothetical protein GCM10010921_09250 [Microbacterium album]|uniref:Uncharacterized protein n=1 Tax=Microbacterium album TaxID=2053191 RepID=A0A917MLJ7_9MICO|nr:hypothetical protein GCM10010921_09250 [Microbacterium album]
MSGHPAYRGGRDNGGSFTKAATSRPPAKGDRRLPHAHERHTLKRNSTTFRYRATSGVAIGAESVGGFHDERA